jgi:hypothetical protein
MKKLVTIMIALSITGTLFLNTHASEEGQQLCHDTQTGEFRPIAPDDNPVPMAPHDSRQEFEKPHLQCNAS